MNRLESATSPYLRQHSRNPVDWYEWGDEALNRARSEQKPIFLSIGYAACHWCHVMAHESFEDPETAALMNENFVNIKVDREQRPDLDSIYMAATVAMTGAGGWPMSVFLTPDLRPFYAGTYFPAQSRYNLPSFRDVLTSLAQVWKEDRDRALEVGAQVGAHLRQPAESVSSQATSFTEARLDEVTNRLYADYDWGFGGWGGAPKFPQPMTIEFLLRRTALGRRVGTSGAAPTGQDPLKPALHALRAMARGGMYDVLGGGFSRYSTDVEWRVPHFEKMLYDNAQLALVYLHAWLITGEPFFRQVVEETLGFILRELTAPEGGFYSSLDADSEGREGKFYIWSFDEIKSVLGDEFDLFRTAYLVTPGGNWEGQIVLQRSLDDSTLAAKLRMTPEALAAKLDDCRGRMFAARSQRPRPGTDDKVLTSWNGLMLSAFAQAARFLRQPDSSESNGASNPYLSIATRNADFLLASLAPGGELRRSWRAGESSSEVFLEDYAALACGLLDLYETDFNPRWFSAALRLADEMLARFDDPSGGFFDTPADGEQLLLRPKDLQDNATPCGNSLACDALLRLAAFTDRQDFREKAEPMLANIAGQALRYPTAFSRWLQAADLAMGPVRQIAIVGEHGSPRTDEMITEVRRLYRPRSVIAASSIPVTAEAPVLLRDRPLIDGRTTAYVCEGFACKLPVTTVGGLRDQL